VEPISTLATQLAILAQMIATGGVLDTKTLMLFKNPVTLDKTTVIGTLVECDFVGYAAVAAQVFGTPYIDQGGQGRTDAPSVDFQMTAATTPNTVYGWAIVNAGKTALVMAALFPTPIPLTVALQGFSVQPTFGYGD
jgi:hypothetical protein